MPNRDVLDAAHLGWTMAELRGRLRHHSEELPTVEGRIRFDLPLGQERTETEQLIEYREILAGLGRDLGVDFPVTKLSGHPPGMEGLASDWLKRAMLNLSKARDSGSLEQAHSAWEWVAECLYSWDAKIQDTFAPHSTRSAAYQLARGVAEIRWGLDLAVSDATDHQSRGFLLGEARGERLCRLLDRLSGEYDPVTRHAIEYTLQKWRSVAPGESAEATENWTSALAGQATIWRDLILGERTGASLVSPRDILDKPVRIVPLFVRLAPEIAVVVASALLLLGAASLLASPSGSQQLGAVIGVLGLLGATAAGISARARASAMQILTRLREQIYLNLAAENALVKPSAGVVGREATPRQR